MAADDPEAAFRSERRLLVLRGKTGTGKTEVLQALAACGAQVLDLEALAGHRGSAFGGLGLPAQPSHAQFQAALARAWHDLVPDGVAFSEHEGPYIGSVGLPTAIFERLGAADWIHLDAPIDARVARIATTYGSVPAAELTRAFERMRGRLDRKTRAAVRSLIQRGCVRDAIRALLPYYDRAYAHQLAAVTGRMLHAVDVAGRSCAEVAGEILQVTAAGWTAARA